MRKHFYLVFSLIIFCFLRQDVLAQLVINEVLINATTANNDGNNSPNTGEWTELLNNSASPLDISCYVMTDGDWSVTFPPGTILPPFGIITIGSPFSQIPGLDINLANCNCTSGPTNQIGIFTNDDEQLIIANSTGQIIDGIYWGSGQFAATPSFTTSNLFGCSSVTVPIVQSNPLIQQISGSTGETETVYLPCDGSGNVLSGNTNPTPDAPNIGPIQTIDPNENIIHESCGVLGSISINPSGGVGPYTYQWTGASGTSTSITGLQDGNYTVAITDQGQCNSVQTFPFVVLTNNSVNLLINASSSAICAGQSTTLTVSGGSNYIWITTATLSASTGDVVTATPNVTTTYTVQDNTAGCINTADITIQVNNPPTTPPSYNNPLCEGDQLILSSNTTTGSASWSGPNGFNSAVLDPVISNVNQNHAGTYTLTLTENNCSASFNLPVSIDIPTIPNIDPAGPFCPSDAPADLNASAEPGTWTGSGITDSNTGIFNPTLGNLGNNNIVFQSNSYCTAPANVVVVIISNGDASIDPIGNLCETTPPFALQTATAGGSWTGNGVSNLGVVSPALLGPGNYQATYTLPGSCGATETLNFVINNNPVTVPTYNNPLCEGDQLILSSNTTTGSASWSGPNGFNSAVLDPMISNVSQSQAGTYTLTLTENNCSASFNLLVSIDTPTIPTISPAGPFCPSDAPVDLNASAEPGTWTGSGITDSNTGIFDPTLGNLGNNNIVFQSNSYCTSPASLAISIQPFGDASIIPIGSICEDSSPLQLQTITPGGQWTGNGVTTGGIVQPTLLGAGSYQAIYTLPGNCGTSETLIFVINSNPIPSISVSNNQVCIPSEVQLNASNSSSNWQCEWWVDGNIVGTDCNNQDFLVDQVNCINVQLLVTDGTGCAGSSIEPNLICGQMPPVAFFTLNPEKPVATDNFIEFIDLSTNANQLLWEIQGENFTTPTVEYPITGTEESIQLCLTAINPIGCEDKTCKIINILDDYGVYVPTAFTPNEDGYNDGFGPVLYNLPLDELNYEFTIYSRDGEQVFLSKNPKQKWHGNKDGGDVYVLQDSYVWVLKLNLPGEGERKIYRGDVKILR